MELSRLTGAWLRRLRNQLLDVGPDAERRDLFKLEFVRVRRCRPRESPFGKLKDLIQKAQELDVPVRWTQSNFQVLRTAKGIETVAGWLITAVATLFGAPFWFDALQQVVRLKGSGPSPAEKLQVRERPPNPRSVQRTSSRSRDRLLRENPAPLFLMTDKFC